MSTEAPTGACAVCAVVCSNRCAKCKGTFYCSREHQVSHWPEHKGPCKAISNPTAGTSESKPKKPPSADPLQQQASSSQQIPSLSPNGWAAGLSAAKQYEWLLDCHCMRLDDNYVYAGDLVGLYNPESGAMGITESFFKFCCLAEKNGVIPRVWDWKSFLQLAPEHIIYAFEKSDAQEKYGGENVFSAAMGGRSLRFTAEQVYGTTVYEGSCVSAGNQSLIDAIDETGMFDAEKARFKKHARLFSKVGGVEAWEKLFRDVNAKHSPLY